MDFLSPDERSSFLWLGVEPELLLTWFLHPPGILYPGARWSGTPPPPFPVVTQVSPGPSQTWSQPDQLRSEFLLL